MLHNTHGSDMERSFQRSQTMTTITTHDGIEIFYKDWGPTSRDRNSVKQSFPNGRHTDYAVPLVTCYRVFRPPSGNPLRSDEECHGRGPNSARCKIAVLSRRKSPRAAVNDCYHTHIFDDLRRGVGREGRLALVPEYRQPANASAAGTLGVFHSGGRRRHRSPRRPADPAGSADTGRQGCRLRGLHRPTT